MKKTVLPILALAAVLCGQIVHGQTSTFTYQGRLQDNGAPATGIYDLRFAIYDAETGGTNVTGVLTNAATTVSNGVFSVQLDFGASAFDGSARWLDIGVRTTGDTNDFTTLLPRQPITSMPYAIQSANATAASVATSVSGSISAGQLTGTISSNNIGAGTITGVMLADGAVSSNNLAAGSVTATALAPGAVSTLGAPDGSPVNALQVNTNGLVGIGTNSPQAGLHVTSAGTGSTMQVLFEQQDDSNGYTNLVLLRSSAIFNNLLAVGSLNEGITVLDVSNSLAPTLLSQFQDGNGTFTNLSRPVSLAMKANLLAVAAENDNTVTLISLTNPASPVKLAELQNDIGGWNELNAIQSMAISGNIIAMASSADHAVTLADISNPSLPVKRVEIKDGFFGFTNLAGASSVALSGTLLAIGAYDDSAVTLVNITDPAFPIKWSELRDGINGFNHLSGVPQVALQGNILAIGSDFEPFVTLVNIANPASPVKLAEIPMSGNFVGLALSTNRVAIASYNQQYIIGVIDIFDISTPSTPRLLHTVYDGQAGFDFLNPPSSLAFSNSDLVIAGEDAITIAGVSSVSVGLVSQQWVGIGVESPAAALHVAGDVIVQNAGRFDINASQVELGFLASARGTFSTAIGYAATASGDYSTAMGYGGIASGDYSTTIGYHNFAIGSYSMAMGFLCHAEGQYSTAMGFGSGASGDRAIAMGEFSSADGPNSFAAGQRALAIHSGAFVWADRQDNEFWSTGTNQFLIRAAGGVGINHSSPATALDVQGAGTAAGGRSPLPEVTARFKKTGGAGDSAISVDSSPLVDSVVYLAENGSAVWGLRHDQSDTNKFNLRYHKGGLNVTYLTVAANGFVGINHSNPATALDVQGAGTTAGGRSPFSEVTARFTKTGAGDSAISVDSSPLVDSVVYLAESGSAVWGLRHDQSDTNKFNLRFHKNGANTNYLTVATNGNVGIGTTNPTNRLHVVGNVAATAFVTTSDRNAKENFTRVESRDVLEKVARLPISQWNFKEMPGVPHFGPMAQDFHAAFGLGGSDTGIATVDADGVAFAAIQGLNQKMDVENKKLRTELKSRDTEIQELKQTVSELKTLVEQLVQPKKN